jgi:signal transduction histidine kinase
MMREQVTRLSGMVGELRDLIHLSLQEDLMIHVEEVQVKELSETALRAVRFGCAHAGIGLDSSVPDGLPPVTGDPDRLPRSLTSLLFHARKFRTAGPLVVSAGLTEDRRFVEFTVEYQGQVLPKEHARQALELYFPARQRGDQSMTATGLGLGIVRELALLQGGDLLHETDGAGRYAIRCLMPTRGAPAKDL